MAAIKINAQDAMEQVSLDVRIAGVRVARARVWLAAQIMKLAGVMAGCEIRVEHGRDFDDLPPLPRTRRYIIVGSVEVPCQASVERDSPLYVANAPEWGRKVDFYLDGVRQEAVVSYDLDAGYMRVHKIGPDGQRFADGDRVATEILQGQIEVRPAP